MSGAGERGRGGALGVRGGDGEPCPGSPAAQGPAPLVLCGMSPRWPLAGEGEGFLPWALGCSRAGGAHAGPPGRCPSRPWAAGPGAAGLAERPVGLAAGLAA